MHTVYFKQVLPFPYIPLPITFLPLKWGWFSFTVLFLCVCDVLQVSAPLSTLPFLPPTLYTHPPPRKSALYIHVPLLPSSSFQARISQMRENTQYLVLCIWLILLNMMISSSIYLAMTFFVLIIHMINMCMQNI
jgi:hypothetical protein